MMTMEQRIEAAARKLGYRYDDHTIRAVLAAAFPEMFDGTAWIAPMEATDTMCAALDSYDPEWPTIREEFRRQRDAHLTPAGRETSKDGEG